ncbi:RNA recognition motif domain-containing protein [Blastomonas sp. SL216]|uniref:RNA recognition motif domain-containing protein n=1 Tax=Blastomonas sp. SL216 TaxID=2995169 RepID=UPI002376E33A|nr:RNA-binding protein [Blastomonas sp. SL216]
MMKLLRSAPVIALAAAILAATVQGLPAAAQSGAPPKSKSSPPARVAAKTEIIVTNFSTYESPAEVEQAFRKEFGLYGTVVAIKIPTDAPPRRSRGYASITMATLAEAQAAVDAMDGAEYLGRDLKVALKR